MRIRSGTVAAFIALTLGTMSCAETSVVGPDQQAPVALGSSSLEEVGVRFSEIHYDDAGTDINEAIEISGPAGTPLTGYSIVLYNGSGGAVYNTTNLTGTIPATCGTRGVVVINYPVNGIQNGDPDGMALVGPSGVIEFLSYEGTFVAVGGPAGGMTSTDIGVRELGEPEGLSLQRTPTGGWTGPVAHTFGSCNDIPVTPNPVVTVVVEPAGATILEGGVQTFTATGYDEEGDEVPGTTFSWTSSNTAVATVNATTGTATGVAVGEATITATASNGASGDAALEVEEAPPPPEEGPTFISEIHYDNSGADIDERIEVEAPAGQNMSGWSLVLYNGSNGASYGTIALSGIVPNLCSGRGVIVVPAVGLQNGSPDGIALVNGTTVVEFISYEGAMTASNGPANGMTSTDIGVQQNGSQSVTLSLQRRPLPSTTWYGPATRSFGACNDEPPPPPPNTISFSGRNSSDPALPVGYQDQLFATVRDGDGNVVVTPVNWSSDTPAIASIDANGVFTALSAGTAVLRATTPDGTVTGTWSLPTRIAVAGGTASYLGNAEFGEPADADAGDDFIVRYEQFTYSYNRNRGTPNWVSYNIDASHFGPEDRCDCFTFDAALPADFARYTTADYTGAGAFHGYGIDRGHLARSFDRTTGSLDNARTFLFSNIIPQAADLNQGPWAVMESYLGDLARFSNKEVYVVTGVAGSKGTVKDEGKIVIPAQVWKVAVIMPRDQGLVHIDSYDDVEVIAVIAPNDAGVRSMDWNAWRTTVDAVEALTGYDLLDLLPDQVEIAVESGTRPPVASLDGPYSTTEGGSVSMSAAGSTDPDGDALTYSWSFSDGGSASGPTAARTYAQDGAYTVTVTVTDVLGLTSSATATVSVSNVAPSVSAIAGATLLAGETYSASGSFTDPGADTWTATVDYGDGSGPGTLALSGMNFSLSRTYTTAGSYIVTVGVSDDDATSTSSATVTVLTAAQGIGDAIAIVNQLVAEGVLSNGNANSLKSKLENARKLLDSNNAGPAVNILEALLNELAAMVRSGRLSAEDAAEIEVIVRRVIRSASM